MSRQTPESVPSLSRLDYYEISLVKRYAPIVAGVSGGVTVSFWLGGAITFYALGMLFFVGLYTRYFVVLSAATQCIHQPGPTPERADAVTERVELIANDLGITPPTVVFTTTLQSAAALDFYSDQYLLVNTALVDIVDDDELTAILAHELYHLTESEGLLSFGLHTVHGLGYLVFAILFTTTPGMQPLHTVSVGLPSWSVYTLLALGYGLSCLTLVNHVQRSYELQADEYAATLVGPTHIATALVKTLVYNSGQTAIRAQSWAESLCRVCFADHPSLSTRFTHVFAPDTQPHD